MKKLANLLVLAVIFTLPAFAQRGGHGSAGAGGHMGGSTSTMGSSHANDHSMARTSGQPAMGKQSSSDILSRNTKLVSNLQKVMPGFSAQTCDGFKNLGQCIAAVHVSHNVPGVTFEALQAKMTGT